MITIDVRGTGVTEVNLLARTEAEEKDVLALYNKISHLVREIDAVICADGKQSVSKVGLA